MAQYKINYACGHEEIVQLYGKISEREYRISRMEKQLCPECWKKQQAEKAKKQTEEEGLPALEGSEKQIAWANQIRLALLKERTKILAALAFIQEQAEKALQSNPEEEEDIKSRLASCNHIAESMICDPSKTSARYWIDKRNHKIDNLEMYYSLKVSYREWVFFQRAAYEANRKATCSD